MIFNINATEYFGQPRAAILAHIQGEGAAKCPKNGLASMIGGCTPIGATTRGSTGRSRQPVHGLDARYGSNIRIAGS